MANLAPDARDIIISGKRLETLRYPSTSRDDTIVMLHEGLGSVTMWKDFPEQLARRTGCGVLLYSRYGHGKSQPLGEKRGVDFMHHEATIVLPELLECFQLQRPILLGHSDGGSIALIYAGTYPDMPSCLILEAPHVFVEGLCMESIQRIGELYKTTQLQTSLRRYHDYPDEMFWGWNEIWLRPEFCSWNIEEYLDKIVRPVLVIQGEQDEYGTVAQLQAIKNRVAQAETLLLPDCGHAPHRDQAAITLDAIARFVSGVN